MTNNQNIGDAIRQALSEVSSLADSQTIIGDPISVGETTIIPVSKVSIGVGIGGGTYGKETSNGAGAGGTGLTVSPVAFIVIDKNGSTSILNVGSDPVVSRLSGTVSEIDKALDNVPDIIQKVKKIFKKGKKEEAIEETTTDEAAVDSEPVEE